MARVVLYLSDLVGSTVRSSEGEVLGQLVDLSAEVAAGHPTVRRVAVGRRRRAQALLAWSDVTSFEHDDIRVSITGAEARGHGDGRSLEERELLLVRDVLDTQVVDVAGKRMARVSDVLLVRTGATLRIAAVDVGASGVWRRLGFERRAARTPEQLVDWADLHLTSPRGHALQLGAVDAPVHRLSAPDLASVVANLPTAKAADVIGVVSPRAAAGALSVAHPTISARLLQAVPGPTGASVVARMPLDDAAAALRGLPPDDVDRLLEGVVSERAATLRRLLAHPADTAGGLMTTEVRVATATEPVASIRARAAAALPDLEGPATVIVVDADGRPVGSYEPNDLLSGRTTPRPVPPVPASWPVERVVDLFALHDVQAVPVVDADGVLVGVIAVDDVLEELLAERLPGQGRYGRIRRRRRDPRPRGRGRAQPLVEA